MEERMVEPAEEVAQQPPVEENDESDGEEGGRMFAWVVNDNMEEDEEDEDDEEVEVEDEQPLDTEASESFELDAPAERSGHIAVVYENIMYVWGGYRVSTFTTKTLQSIDPFQSDPNIFCYFFFIFMYKNSRMHGFFDLYLPRNEIWTYNMVSGVW